MNFLRKRLLHSVPDGKSVIAIDYRRANETYMVLTILLLSHDNLAWTSYGRNKMKINDILHCVSTAEKEA